MKQYRYWIRTAAGLEKTTLRELDEKFALENYEIKHKSLLLNLSGDSRENEKAFTFLKTADDVYYFLGSVKGITNTKASSEKIPEFFEQELPSILQDFPEKYARVTVSFLGSRNFNRFEVENSINKILASRGSKIILSNEDKDKWQFGEKRFRIHIEDETAYFGAGLFDKPLHRRDWRINSYPAQLHPPIAAAMVMIADPADDLTIIDPFCGSGTILIESALRRGGGKHYGFDIDEKAVETARANSALAKTNIEFKVQEFYKTYKNFDDYFIISNLPWGGKHKIDKKDEDYFFEKLLAIVRRSQGAILLVPDDFIARLKKNKLRIEEALQTRIRGKLASVIRLYK